MAKKIKVAGIRAKRLERAVEVGGLAQDKNYKVSHGKRKTSENRGTYNSVVETLFWLQTLLLQSKEHHAVSGRNVMAYLGNHVEFGVNTSLVLLLQTKGHYAYRIMMCYLA